jgi:hypothetical protein
MASNEEIILALMTKINEKDPKLTSNSEEFRNFIMEFQSLFGKKHPSDTEPLMQEERETRVQELIKSLQGTQDFIEHNQIRKDFSLKDQEKIISALMIEIAGKQLHFLSFIEEFNLLIEEKNQLGISERLKIPQEEIETRTPKLMRSLQRLLSDIKKEERDDLEKVTKVLHDTRDYVKENNLPEGFLKDVDLLFKERSSMLISDSIAKKIEPFREKAKGLGDQIKEYQKGREALKNLCKKYESTPSKDDKSTINKQLNELKQLTSKHSKDISIENFEKKFIHPQNKINEQKEQLGQITATFKKIYLKLAFAFSNRKKTPVETKQTKIIHEFGLSKKSHRAPSLPALESERVQPYIAPPGG